MEKRDVSNNNLSSCFQKANKNIITFTLSKSYIALAFGILLFLSGCGMTKSADLREVENSASIIQLKTGREIERYASDKISGPLVVSPTYPKVLIQYEPLNNYTKKEVFDEIVAILTQNNWKVERSAVSDYFEASLLQGQCRMLTSVLIETNIVTVVITCYPH